MIPREILKKIRQIELRANRIVTGMPCALAIFLSVLLLCSCATPSHPSAIVAATELPAETAINKDAGRGGHLTVTLRLEDGEEMLFMVDTGSPFTLLDKSLKSKLGKRRDTKPISFPGGGHEEAGLFAAPKLYWGNTRLMTGNFVAVHDFNAHSSRTNASVMGVLGMDCLRYYCLQLDFEAEKIRFLNSDQKATAELGRAFPVTFFRGFYPHVQRANFVGNNTNLLIDVGCNVDGMVDTSAIHGLAVFFSEQDWGGETYTNLIVGAVGHANALGLRFLARHLVTFDFPKSTMYLKQRNIGPLAGDHSLKGSHFGDLQSPMDFLMGLKETNQLRDWSKNDRTPICFEACSNSALKALASVTFGFQENTNSYSNHYMIDRASEDSPWKLHRAWRADQDGNTIEEFPVP
jgi:Aspartyl protease